MESDSNVSIGFILENAIHKIIFLKKNLQINILTVVLGHERLIEMKIFIMIGKACNVEISSE